MVGFVLDLAVGKAERGEAGSSVELIAQGIASLGRRGAVVAPAVGLHHQAEVRPVEINLEAIDLLLGERRGETGLIGDRSEQDFELSIGEKEGVAVEQGAKRSHARVCGVGVDREPQRLGIDPIPLVRLIDRSLELPRSQLSREVQQRPSRNRDGDRAKRSDIIGAKPAPDSDVKTRPAQVGMAAHRDVDARWTVWRDPP